MQIQSQIKSNQLEIQNYERRRKDFESQISAYQIRLNLTPAIEQELTDVSRGYEGAKANYDSLLQKQNQSQLATSLEQRQQGEHFSIIDPPSSPLKPFSPNHLMISLGGLGFGLVVGCGLVAFVELTNVCIRRREDLAGLIRAPVLVGIPSLRERAHGHLRALRQGMEIVAVVGIVVLIVAGNFYAFYKG
jgi:succinoglycan biosynthesis transport protein ExoP